MRFLSRSMMLVAAASLLVTTATGQSKIRIANPGAGAINLPYPQADNNGNQWMLCQGGFLQQQGNMPLYSQGGLIMANNQRVQQNNNQARTDDATGEIILDNLTVGQIQFTRRVKFDAATGFVRMIDVFKNSTGKELPVNFVVQSQFHYQTNGTGAISDSRRKGHTLAWVGSTGNQGWRSVVEIYNGKRSKLRTNSGFGTGNNYVWGNYSLLIPPGKEMAVMHLHGSALNAAAGEEYVNSLDERKLMKDIPRDIRKLIVNFGGGDTAVGDLELLRGELFDVVEINGGDQFKGTIKMPSYKLTTPYGPIELPENKVIALFNIGQFKARQLVVTSDGQVIGGQLDRPAIDVELSSGQVTKIPLNQITRLGYRKRADEPEEWTFEKPYVALRTGERMFVGMPVEPVSFASRYGLLKVDPKSIAAINWQSDNSAVHELALVDGTTLAGLFGGERLELVRDGSSEPIKIDASLVLRWQFKNLQDGPDGDGPFLDTTSGDHFAGSLSGPLHVETSFDALEIAGEQIAHLERLKDSSSDVQITLWDGATVSGRLVEADLPVKTLSGLEMKVPLGLLKEYDQPLPRPPAAMVEQIKTLVGQLNADDWKERDRAQEQLAGLGVSILSVLNDLRTTQPAESQQRIDAIVKQLTGGKGDGSKPAVNPQPGGKRTVED